MAIEIERKFLVSGDFLPEAVSSTRIVQGYICSQPGRTVRIRIRGEEGFLTIKGASDEKGLSRYELSKRFLWWMPSGCWSFASRVRSTRFVIWFPEAAIRGKSMFSTERMKG